MNAQNPLISFPFLFWQVEEANLVLCLCFILGKKKEVWHWPSPWRPSTGPNRYSAMEMAALPRGKCHQSSEQHDLKENSIVIRHRSPHRCQCLTFVALRNENTSVKAFSSSCSSYKQRIYEKKPAGGQWRKSFTSAPQRPGREFRGVLDPLLLSSPLHHTLIQVTRC